MTDSNRGKKCVSRIGNGDRHQSHCSICAHPQRQQIDEAFVSWKRPAGIAAEFKLPDRSAVYRHAHATGLMERRGRNIREVLDRLIERADEVEVTGPFLLQVIDRRARMNARGEIVARSESVGRHELFDRMTVDELLAYAEAGVLPDWFPREDEKPEGSGGNGNE